jgi:hypothetical protein
VFAVWPNLALQQQTSSSGVFADGISFPRNAVDGNIDPIYGDGSCFQSSGGADAKPWWSVDLGATYYVQYVILTTRKEEAESECVISLLQCFSSVFFIIH